MRLRTKTCCFSITDVFNKFTDKKNGKFKDCLIKDKRDLLSLYEASYLATKHEDELLQAMEFTATHLKQILNNTTNNALDQMMMSEALEVPRHLRMARLESRNFIHQYSIDPNHNSNILDFAMLDYNSVQSLHQNELSEIIR